MWFQTQFTVQRREGKMIKKRICAALAVMSLALVGCDTVRDSLGLSHYQPDDFAISNPKPALSIPPDFSVVPPQLGAKERGQKSAPNQAHQTLFKADAIKTASSNTTWESDFLQTAAQGKNIDPAIKEKVDEEAKADNPLMNALTSLKNQASRNLKITNKKSDVL